METKRLKHVPELSSAEIKQQFMKETTDNYIIFGGAVRDLIAGVESNDIDVYVECHELSIAKFVVERFIRIMNKYSFRKIENSEIGEIGEIGEIDWTTYKDLESNDQFPAIVLHYEVGYKDIFFKVDLVLSRYKPCFGNLDCIVNGLQIHKNCISFVDNFKHEGLRRMDNSDLVMLAKKLIAERRAGMFRGCDQHRIKKMVTKGYNVDFI